MMSQDRSHGTTDRRLTTQTSSVPIPVSLASAISIPAGGRSALARSCDSHGWSIQAGAELLALIFMLGLCVALSACGGASGGGGGGGAEPFAEISPKDLTYDSQIVGTASAPETSTLTNTGTAALNITSVSITGTAAGDFSQTNNCPAALSPGANCSINVTFTPSANGDRIASITIADNAANTPQSLSVGGDGTGSSNVGNCAGSVLPQSQMDVTSQLSYANTAAGVDVMQLTSSGCNRFYYFDVPAYSSAVNEIVYTNFITNMGNNVLAANPDGENAAILSPSGSGEQAFVSPDGSLAYYARPIPVGTPGGSDIFGGLLNDNPFRELRFTDLDAAPQAGLTVWEISTSSPDPAGGQDIAFSPDLLLHIVPTQCAPQSPPCAITSYTLNDPESATTFHRIRLNPKYPNIVMYKRNGDCVDGTNTVCPELWLVDLNTCTTHTCAASNIVNVVQNLPVPAGVTPKAGHVIWSPDGLDIAFSESDIGDFWIARNVVTADGTLNLTNGQIPQSSLQELGPLVVAGISQITANYCVFPHDWSESNREPIACISGPASLSTPTTFYLLSSDGKGTMKLLAASDAQVLTINGTPMPQFAQDDQHLLFNSDRNTGTAAMPINEVEVYLISGFTLTVP